MVLIYRLLVVDKISCFLHRIIFFFFFIHNMQYPCLNPDTSITTTLTLTIKLYGSVMFKTLNSIASHLICDVLIISSSHLNYQPLLQAKRQDLPRQEISRKFLQVISSSEIISDLVMLIIYWCIVRTEKRSLFRLLQEYCFKKKMVSLTD